jgi:hypothetical protein
MGACCVLDRFVLMSSSFELKIVLGWPTHNPLHTCLEAYNFGIGAASLIYWLTPYQHQWQQTHRQFPS